MGLGYRHSVSRGGSLYQSRNDFEEGSFQWGVSGEVSLRIIIHVFSISSK